MATNPYFQGHLGNEEEQALLNGIAVEAIQLYGQDMLYLPRRFYDEDQIYTEDAQSYFDTAYELEFYLKDPTNFMGDGSILSTFGVALMDSVVLQVATTRFDEEVLAHEPAERFPERRPREGDLVWFPVQRKLFQVSYADKFKLLYPLGSIYTWDLTLHLFKYSQERFETGLPEIDSVYGTRTISQDVLDWAVRDESGDVLLDQSGDHVMEEAYLAGDLDPEDQSDEIEEEADAILDFTETDPFSEGYEY